MKIVNISFVNSYPITSGYQSRVLYYGMALSRHSGIKVKQFCFNPLIFTKMKDLSFNNDNYKVFFRRSLLYTIAIFIIYPIMRIRNWIHVIPIIFRLIKPSRKLREAYKWADIIQVEGPWLVPWVKRFTNKPVLLVAHNVEYDLASSIMEHKCKKHPEFIKKYLLDILYETEKYAAVNSEKIFAASQIDKNKFINLYKIDKNKIEIVPNGINSSVYQKEKKKIEDLSKFKNIVLFTGSAHPPNVIAANFIINILAPLFIKDNVLFLIAGRVFTKRSFKANVLCSGPIDNEKLLEYFQISDIAINPIPYGSGSNIKMFEYLAAGLPVISTPNGVEGVCEEAKKSVITCSLNEFHLEIARLTKNQNILDKLSRLARENVKYHDYEYITKKALDFYQELI